MNFRSAPVAIIGTFIALFFGSFGDEAAQIMFALRIADGDGVASGQVSALLIAGLLGGIAGGALAPRVIVTLGVRRMIGALFVVEAALIAGASLVNALVWYLAVAGGLGGLGSMLWSAVMVALPTLATSEAGIDRANRVVQSVRNLGYVAGPLAGSVLFAWTSGTWVLVVLAVAMFVAAGGAAMSLRRLVGPDVGRQAGYDERRTADVRGLLRVPGVCRAIAPLVVTVLVTSTLNVLLIVRMRVDLGLSAETYGVVVAALSTGLVAGPVLFAGFFGRLGDAAGASAGAALIGSGIVAIGATRSVPHLAVAAAVVGVANGVQNALMASFMIKRIDPERRAFHMPAYVLILQVTVATGFACAAFVDVDAAGPALVVAGAVAAIAGVIGALTNQANGMQVETEGTVR